MINLEQLEKFFKIMAAPLKRKVQLMIGRCILTAVDDSKQIQCNAIKILAGESKDLVEVFNNYGFTSNAPIGSELIMLSVGGNRDHGIIIGSEHRASRLKGLVSGDSAQYNKDGKYLWLEGDKGKLFIEKLTIKNDAGRDFIERDSDLKQKFIDGRILTALGPQQWIAADRVPMQATKDQSDEFKDI